MLLKFSLTGFFMNWITQGGQTVSKLFSVAWIFFTHQYLFLFKLTEGLLFSVNQFFNFIKMAFLALQEKKGDFLFPSLFFLNIYLDN